MQNYVDKFIEVGSELLHNTRFVVSLPFYFVGLLGLGAAHVVDPYKFSERADLEGVVPGIFFFYDVRAE